MRVIFASGGTGGHIYPGLAIAGVLKEKGDRLLFIGTRRGLERRVLEEADFPLFFIRVRPWLQRDWKKLPLVLGQMLVALFQSLWILKKFRPHLVIATGAYLSAPVVLAASLLGIPAFLHEQNLIPGIANRFLSRLWGVKAIGVTYAESKKYFPGAKVRLTGNPVRPEVLGAEKSKGRESLGLDPEKRVVLIFGGSRGARRINTATVEALKIFKDYPQLQILHITGKERFKEVSQSLEALSPSLNPASRQTGYLVYPYLYNMAEALAASDLVVSRAGATTLAEITGRGLPSILVPYPYATGNHQEYNARHLEEKGAAKVVLDRDLTPDKLARTVLEIVNDETSRQRMSRAARALSQPAALDKILEVISEYHGPEI
jgi:UDP-N-acetylglucosamine--N-acetylmuramyl-(pentapeptide) pyrophosphoryl-undecaprenol N-acetylglucosamine transferase